MAWSQSFKSQLDKPSKSIEYLLRFFSSSLNYNGSGQIFGLLGEVKLANAEVTIDNSRVTPSRWSLNFGGFTIKMNGDLREYNSVFKKGQIAELWMIRNGTPERVTIGQLRAISGGRGVWNIEFADLISTMDSRLSLIAGQEEFFYNAGKETTVTATYNFSSDPNLYVADITIFEKEDGKDGLVHVYRASHSTDFYYSWSSKTATSGTAGYLTISNNGIYPKGTNNHLNSGDRVVSCTWLQGRIDEIFAKMLMSTGTAGTTGIYDKYPKSWALGYAFASSLIDKTDLNLFYGTWKATASIHHNVSLIIEEASNARTVINSALNMGLFPVFRQGKISFRGSVNMDTYRPLTLAGRVSDLDIHSIDSHQFYSPNQPVYYSRSRMKYYESSTGSINQFSKNRTLSRYMPSARDITRDNSLIYAELNQEEMATKDLNRLFLWDCYPYEELVITVSEKFAILCAGDVIELTSNYIYGIHELSGERYNRKKCFVMGVRWLPHQSKCILSLAVISRGTARS